MTISTGTGDGTKSNVSNIPRYYMLILLLAIFIISFLTLFDHYNIFIVSNTVLLIFRLITIILIVGYAFYKRSLTTWILISMILGAEFGHDLPQIAVKTAGCKHDIPAADKNYYCPSDFCDPGGWDSRTFQSEAGWTYGLEILIYFEIVSTIALFIGLLAINISKAGLGITVPEVINQENVPVVAPSTGTDLILHIFPENIAKSIYEGQVLQIVVFSIIFGIAVAMIKDKYRNPMLRFTESLAETMFKFTQLIMYFAPFAVFAAIAYTIGHMGLDILFNLFKLLATLYVSLTLFILLVLLPVALLFKIPVRKFIKAVSEPVVIAFATTSSESALPIAMERMEEFGVPRKIVAFVMPTGYSFNLDGTTLYLSLATIFVAQISGIHLPLEKQLLIVFTLMLTSKGVAGVPRASLVILLGTAASFGLPAWPIYIILGIDELMDMARTAVNVLGNCLATAVIARWEGEFNPAPDSVS